MENFFTPKPADREGYDTKLAALAKVITAPAPDLLALQEVGDEASVHALRDLLGAGWSAVPSTHFESPHTIRVGWLSPGSLSDMEEVVDLPTALSPVKVDDNGATLTELGRGALAVTYTAIAEAAAVRDRATTALAGEWADRPLPVCGDLNDTMDAATTQLLFDPPGSQMDTGGFSHPDHGDPQRLWDVGFAMSPPNNYSRSNQGRPELIDHILAHALVGRLTDAATVPLDVPSISIHPGIARRTDPPSDHRPVLAHFGL